jgi:hypothetical protein
VRLIKRICTERRILRYGNTKYSWRLTIFYSNVWDNGEDFTTVKYSIPSFCLLYQHELAAIFASGRNSEGGFQWDTTFINSLKLPRIIKTIPFGDNQARRLLTRGWVDDEIINAYLLLCGYIQPDIKFVTTFWPKKWALWGDLSGNNSIKWVSVFSNFFFFSSAILLKNNAKISKGSSDISAAMDKFTAVITVMNENENHWITLRFQPKEKILLVLDSMQSTSLSSVKKKYREVGPPTASMC